MSKPQPLPGSQRCTAVIDIGKTSSRLLLIDDQGRTAYESAQASASIPSGQGYLALDTEGCERWLLRALGDLGPLAQGLRRVIVTTHGAAVAGIRGEGLAFPVPDYEAEAFDDRDGALADEIDPFAETLSPLLPRGLNMGVQLEWLRRRRPELLAKAELLMPYAQYWAWWLTGVGASEYSSLGCHTLLWNPAERTFSPWARRRGWADKFAPLRKAWETVGVIRPALSEQLGLPPGVQVHVGVHDSNACLARYLRSWPRVTLVSSGTWFVVMSTAGLNRGLHAERDQLANVSVRGEAVPTARFMGGREMARLCAGADPALADPALMQDLLRQGLRILPGFEPQGGAFGGRHGTVRLQGRTYSLDEWEKRVAPELRATAASIYAAQMTAWTIEALGGLGPIVIDGPLAHNAVATCALAALLPTAEVYISRDSVEGTARGAWMLAHWTGTVSYEPQLQKLACDADLARLIVDDWLGWKEELPSTAEAVLN